MEWTEPGEAPEATAEAARATQTGQEGEEETTDPPGKAASAAATLGEEMEWEVAAFAAVVPAAVKMEGGEERGTAPVAVAAKS